MRDAEASDWVFHGTKGGKPLAHTVADRVGAACRRGDLFEKRRRLMADWAAFCGRPAGK